jgi:osmoprotectant transport system ATP-binding protein
VITLRNVSKQFPGSGGYAVRDFSLEIAEGETVVLVGPSGSGKTTILRMINRLIEPTSGTIGVDGADIMSIEPVDLRRRIGYVIQSIGLMPHRTVAQNVGMVCELSGWPAERTRARVTELAAMLELDPELLERYPSELSGGQRQRVGVARALGVDPPVMLMDEPFGAVDPIVRGRLQDQLVGLQSRIRKTIVLVTHDIDEAMKLGDRIAIINRGGVLEQYASPEEILRAPASPFVADFIGSERGLKRLALMAVKSVDTEAGPLVGPDAGVDAALEVMRTHGTDWVAVVGAEEDLLGWVDAKGLSGHARVGEAEARPFSAVVSPTSSLREALDAIVVNKAHVAAVVEDGRYCGLLTLERVARELTAA